MKHNHADRLIDLVLEQIIKDLEGSDMTALAELLSFIPEDKLVGYLPEDLESIHHMSDNKNLEEILHRLIVDIANDKQVFYRMSTKQSFVELCVMMSTKQTNQRHERQNHG